ncbi:MAG: hypothetical protein IJU89_04660 [Alphaproteobacteria bacterium]|nr:hypothetical protein [Alphaproteobacteria bacterium]
MNSNHIVIIACCAFWVYGGVANAAGRSMMLKSGGVGRSVVQSTTVNTDKSSIKFDATDTVESQPKNMREHEKQACIDNNIGNNFVWASRYSNINNYSSMIEDIDNPENNVCFVRVELKSRDSKIKVSDFGGMYFQMGSRITCGSWVDSEKLEARILDAKKSNRTLATVAGSVGGAAVGVGAMEAFGNKMIGGAVQGQQALSGDALLISQLRVLKTDNKSEYDKIVSELQKLKSLCANASTFDAENLCKKYDIDAILSGIAK